MGISEDLKQSKFQSEESKAIVNIIFTGNWMTQKQHELLKPFGLTVQQYNVLRILKGQKGNPMTVLAITERMMDKMSNASRLVDKLLEKKLVLRRECPQDRRAVDVIILPAGIELVDQIDLVQKNGVKISEKLTRINCKTLMKSSMNLEMYLLTIKQ